MGSSDLAVGSAGHERAGDAHQHDDHGERVEDHAPRPVGLSIPVHEQHRTRQRLANHFGDIGAISGKAAYPAGGVQGSMSVPPHAEAIMPTGTPSFLWSSSPK